MANNKNPEENDLDPSMPVDIDAMKVSLLIICNNKNKLESVGTFLERRDWPTEVVTRLDEAIRRLVSNPPDFVLLSFNHENKKLLRLPKFLAQTFNVTTIAFGEQLDTKTINKINNARLKYKMLSNVSGPSVHRRIKQILQELYAPKDEPKRNSYDSLSGGSKGTEKSFEGAVDADTFAEKVGRSNLQKDASEKSREVALLKRLNSILGVDPQVEAQKEKALNEGQQSKVKLLEDLVPNRKGHVNTTGPMDTMKPNRRSKASLSDGNGKEWGRHIGSNAENEAASPENDSMESYERKKQQHYSQLEEAGDAENDGYHYSKGPTCARGQGVYTQKSFSEKAHAVIQEGQKIGPNASITQEGIDGEKYSVLQKGLLGKNHQATQSGPKESPRAHAWQSSESEPQKQAMAEESSKDYGTVSYLGSKKDQQLGAVERAEGALSKKSGSHETREEKSKRKAMESGLPADNSKAAKKHDQDVESSHTPNIEGGTSEPTRGTSHTEPEKTTNGVTVKQTGESAHQSENPPRTVEDQKNETSDGTQVGIDSAEQLAELSRKISKDLSAAVRQAVKNVCEPKSYDLATINVLTNCHVIVVSGKESGYIIVANNVDGDDQKALAGKIHGEVKSKIEASNPEIVIDSVYEIQTDPVEFDVWKKGNGEFYHSENHHSGEVAVSFHKASPSIPKIQPSNHEGKLELNPRWLSTRRPADFKAFLYLEKNQKSLPYINEGRTISEKQKEKLVASKIHLLLDEKHKESVVELYIESFLESLVNDYKKSDAA